jgi:hypothetical protein
MGMTSTVAAYSDAHRERVSIPRLCRAVIGDWTDVRDRRADREKIGLHVTLKAHGNGVIGAIHVLASNKWFRIEVTPAWFCAKGWIYERRGDSYSHVAMVRLCHRNKDRTVLWQVIGCDQTGSLPHEVVLWLGR